MEEIKQVIEELNRELDEALLLLNEMAKLDGGIIVRNDDDDKKFAHFHWKNVHFDLTSEIPKNVTELRQRIHFDKELNLLSVRDLQDLLQLLHSKSQKKAGKGFDTVYEFTIAQWELLNERDIVD